ncbi:hypothetical protein [Chitinophaga pinensis]|uniref:Lipoprotein n=1 Tax=Chitinophaga pinensis (strain ATCC 43595 / DSM 2588 / LMG 13176 / NBRC 15968 / NCIMB 11800 / UQM 2034) TaxID=485918 RepID=A0A979G0Y2_CHIPD|nr:hypothetical protein [Chitinophaga pinensis]ACU58784.1 hypothetical protein Cpin_1286 [Chitinophaga pinensis DSM 2588]
MKPLSAMILLSGLLMASAGCSKDDAKDNNILQKGLRGKIIYSSCATTVVQVLNKDIGAEWTNCHNQQTFQHVIGVNIINRNGIAAEAAFNFNIVQKEPEMKCDMGDCGPINYETIVITGN